MVLNFSDFEGETVGTLPTGWSLGVDDDDLIEVVNTEPVEGDKSFRVGEFAGGESYVGRSVGDEGIRFSFVFDEAESDGNNEEWALEVRDGGGSVLYSWLIFRDNESTDPFNIAFDTAAQLADGSYANGNVGSIVGSVDADTFHTWELRDPTSSLKLFIDGNLVHDTGMSFSGASRLRIVAEDATIRFDTFEVGVPSDFVFHRGDEVLIDDNADQRFTIEGEINDPISDGGTSGFVLVDGTGIDFDP